MDQILTDFHGGVNSRKADDALAPDELQASINAILRDGYIRARDTIKAHQTGVSSAIQSIAYVTAGATQVLTFADPDVTGVEYRGWFYYAAPDFTGRPKKRRLSDGTIQDVGIPAPLPASIPSTSATTGTLTLTDAQWVHTFINDLDGSESPPSFPSLALSLANQGASLPSVSSSDADVTSVQWYRLTAGQYLALPATVALHTATVDSHATLTLGHALASTNYDPPEDGIDGIAGMYEGMVFFWKGNTLSWNVTGKIDACPATYNRVYEWPIKRAVVMGQQGVLVLTSNAVHAISGTSPTGLVNTPIDHNVGCVDGRSAAYAPGLGVMWVSEYGISSYKNGIIQHLSQFKTFDRYDDNPRAVYTDSAYFLFRQDDAQIFDEYGQGVSVHGCSHSVSNALDGITQFQGDVYYLHDEGADKTIYKWSPDTQAACVTLPYEVTTRSLVPSQANHKMHPRRVFVEYSGTLRVEMYVDGVLRDTQTCPEKAIRGTHTYLTRHSIFGQRISFKVYGGGTLYKIGPNQMTEIGLP